MLGDGIGLRNLEQALARYIEIGEESGVATGGSNTTLEDTTKNWPVNRWVGGDIHIVKAGIEYVRTISANTATAITFAALPGVIAPAAGDPYSVRSRRAGAKTATTVLDEATIAAATTTVLVDCAAVGLSYGPTTLALTVKAIYGAAALGIRLHVLTSPTNDATGTHTAAPSATILTDATAHWVVNRLVGLTVFNITDGSTGVITANTINTVTVAALAGGTLNQWSLNDVYSIPGADYDTEDWDTWDPAFAANLPVVQTQVYEVDPMYVKVLVENRDAGVAVTLVEVIATVGP